MEKDLRSSNFFSDNERYADIINGFGCDGDAFVTGEDLQELDTKGIRGKGKGRKSRPIYRDLLRKASFGMNFAIVGIENQEEIDYALPLRIMSYDAGTYEYQAAKIRKQVRGKAQRISPGEYLYGFKKDSRLFPTVTFVLYFGEKDWDGAKDIHGMLDFSNIPECLKEKVSNYYIHIIEVRKLKDTDFLKTDVKQVFDFIRFSKDKRKLKKLIENDPVYSRMDEEAYDMAVAYTGDEEMFELKKKYKKGGKINMCQGLADWIADERAEGREEGKAEGKAEGREEGKAEGSERMSRLIIALTEQGRSEELLKAAKDSEYCERLFKELRI